MNESESSSYTFAEASANNKIEVSLNNPMTIRGIGIKCSKDLFPQSLDVLEVVNEKNSSKILSVKNLQFSSPH